MSINIIVAFCKNFGIGSKGHLPWSIPHDLMRFRDVTKGNIVVMGRKTYESIPDEHRPLKDRINIVVTSGPSKYTQSENLIFVGISELDSFIDQLILQTHKDVFVIGGQSLYEHFLGVAEKIIATVIDKEYICDTFFPTKKFGLYEIESYNEQQFSKEEQCNYKFITYIKSNKKHGEHVYLDHMKNILDNGNDRQDRTGTGTKSVFGGQLRFDISSSVPILTTKFVPFQLTVKELLFFLRGQTDSKILEAQGVNIWKGNTSRAFLDSRGLVDYEEGDMGPMYFFNIFHMGAEYKGCHHDYTGQGLNQLENFIDGLKKDPWSRRHIMTTFDPLNVDKCVLYPCHGLNISAYYSEKDGKKMLSLHVYIRSSDGFLGLPINILSYAILTYIIAKKCDYLPHELIISFGDAHIYKDHYDAVTTQLSRNVLPFPMLILDDTIKNKDFKDIQLSDFKLIGYLSHSKITAPMAI
jgi:dihydrofolate reductase / thymidylate synthase